MTTSKHVPEADDSKQRIEKIAAAFMQNVTVQEHPRNDIASSLDGNHESLKSGNRVDTTSSASTSEKVAPRISDNANLVSSTTTNGSSTTKKGVDSNATRSLSTSSDSSEDGSFYSDEAKSTAQQNNQNDQKMLGKKEENVPLEIGTKKNKRRIGNSKGREDALEKKRIPKANVECEDTHADKPVIQSGLSGTVKWFDLKLGFGFISVNGVGEKKMEGDASNTEEKDSTSNLEDVFVHKSGIIRSLRNGTRSLGKNESVEFDIVQGEPHQPRSTSAARRNKDKKDNPQDIVKRDDENGSSEEEKEAETITPGASEPKSLLYEAVRVTGPEGGALFGSPLAFKVKPIRGKGKWGRGKGDKVLPLGEKSQDSSKSKESSIRKKKNNESAATNNKQSGRSPSEGDSRIRRRRRRRSSAATDDSSADGENRTRRRHLAPDQSADSSRHSSVSRQRQGKVRSRSGRKGPARGSTNDNADNKEFDETDRDRGHQESSVGPRKVRNRRNKNKTSVKKSTTEDRTETENSMPKNERMTYSSHEEGENNNSSKKLTTATKKVNSKKVAKGVGPRNKNAQGDFEDNFDEHQGSIVRRQNKRSTKQPHVDVRDVRNGRRQISKTRPNQDLPSEDFGNGFNDSSSVHQRDNPRGRVSNGRGGRATGIHQQRENTRFERRNMVGEYQRRDSELQGERRGGIDGSSRNPRNKPFDGGRGRYHNPTYVQEQTAFHRPSMYNRQHGSLSGGGDINDQRSSQGGFSRGTRFSGGSGNGFSGGLGVSRPRATGGGPRIGQGYQGDGRGYSRGFVGSNNPEGSTRPGFKNNTSNHRGYDDQFRGVDSQGPQSSEYHQDSRNSSVNKKNYSDENGNRRGGVVHHRQFTDEYGAVRGYRQYGNNRGDQTTNDQINTIMDNAVNTFY